MPGVMDTECKRARVWLPHKVINNIILHRWTRWKKAEFPKGNSIKRKQFCKCQRERTWIRARDWHGAFLINIYRIKKDLKKSFKLLHQKLWKTQKIHPRTVSTYDSFQLEENFLIILFFAYPPLI